MSTETKVLKKCTKCGEMFITLNTRRRICAKCRQGHHFGRTDPIKRAREEIRRKLPSMDRSFLDILLVKGVRTFHNGGTRTRWVTGFSGVFILYKSRPESRATTGIWVNEFMKWCKGYVINGVWYDRDGNVIKNENEGAENDA